MSEPTANPRLPRFNHVAMSLAADRLDEHGRREIVDFYADVFGWEELPTLTEDRQRLVLQAYRFDQFVFLMAEDEPMTAPRMDHFGLSVSTIEELDEIEARIKAWKARDDRIDLIEKHVDDQGVVRIWSVYVRHLLPMMIEIQFFEIAENARELVEEYNRRVAAGAARDAAEGAGEPEEPAA